MTHNRRTENSAEHLEVSALLPWYVNETLAEADRLRVETHAGNCMACREDLAAQQRICEAIEAQPVLNYMPVASLKRLQARLDTLAAPAATPPQEQPANRMPWRGWMAASIAAVAVAVALFAADRWVLEQRLQPSYRTVTSSVPRPQGEVIRAVFSPAITLVELQTILDEAQLRIVSGPTEAGVYSLASNSTLTVHASLALLRQHSTVRFAEGTVPEPESGNSR
ncbi:MAG TPA: zf-HC2 domain-containing protein [Steroidobacteraceae bacterium]|nr:zf-HC2 domain-containing protein [Steroidobacteraceae bacterium]